MILSFILKITLSNTNALFYLDYPCKAIERIEFKSSNDFELKIK